MPYNARVYRILIASPSDVEEERDIAVKAIQDWNDLHSFTRKVALLPLRWETHTAPEYGERPQEIINRAIVDDSDILVGVFWSRIGSPTGVAQSGTIEEIERTGAAGKRIMLYFSQVPIDPEQIDLDQMSKLKQFKSSTYPNGLIENFKSRTSFRDKFSRQLEIAVRDLQASEAGGFSPLVMEFVSIHTEDFQGSQSVIDLEIPKIKSFNAVPREKRQEIETLAQKTVKARTSIPLTLAVKNIGSSGVRNIYAEMRIRSTKTIEIKEHPPAVRSSFSFLNSLSALKQLTGLQTEENQLKPLIERFDDKGLKLVDGVWRFYFEWPAIQPQRTRLINPIFYILTTESTEITIDLKLLADSFPNPIVLTAKLLVNASQKNVDLSELLPDWKDLTKKEVVHAANLNQS